MPDYHNNQLVITIDEWKSSGLTYTMYENDKKRGYLKTVGRSCFGKVIMIYWDSIVKTDRKAAILEKFGNITELKKQADLKPFKESIEPDDKAVKWFSDFYLKIDGPKSDKNIIKYSNSAAILNALHNVITKCIQQRAACGNGKPKKLWQTALNLVNEVNESYPNSLPRSEKRLHEAYIKYLENGYSALLNGRIGNENSRKVNNRVESLVMSLYYMKEKPFAATVFDLYNKFIKGDIIDLYDEETGEIFNPLEFEKNGRPLELSEGTIWRILNKPKNRPVVDKGRKDNLDYNNTHRPHVHRHAPFYSFSKISLDDRDLPRKLHNGKRVKAYYAYDVASGCVIGSAYSLSKNEELFLDCLRDTFRLIERNEWGMPLEVEVEHHLVNKFFDDLALMFPFMRICNPANSQEKRAEHFNKAKKYSTEKINQVGIGRWWAKSDAYRTPSTKVADEFKEKTYDYERLIADDRQSIIDYNNSLHKKQKTYPGMTRWQVLTNTINPKTPKLNKAILYKCIGGMTKTSINRNQYCQVKNNDYVLPSPELIERLAPGNYEVKAYYLEDYEKEISEVYLYQNDKYICCCKKLNDFNESQAEMTPEDHEEYTNQSAYISKFDGMVKKDKAEKIVKVRMIKKEEMTEAIEAAKKVETVSTPVLVEDNDDENYTSEYMRAKALESI